MKFLNILGITATLLSFAGAIYWQYENQNTLMRNIAIGIGLLFFLSWVLYRIFYPNSNSIFSNQAIQKGTQKISLERNRVYEIFYSAPFLTVPNLFTEIKEGKIDFEIIEQRKDGFKIKTVGRDSVSYNSKMFLEWKATGN